MKLVPGPQYVPVCVCVCVPHKPFAACEPGGCVFQAADVDKLTADVSKAIQYFAYFICCYKDARVPEPLRVVAKHRRDIPVEPLVGATYLDDGSR